MFQSHSWTSLHSPLVSSSSRNTWFFSFRSMWLPLQLALQGRIICSLWISCLQQVSLTWVTSFRGIAVDRTAWKLSLECANFCPVLSCSLLHFGGLIFSQKLTPLHLNSLFFIHFIPSFFGFPCCTSDKVYLTACQLAFLTQPLHKTSEEVCLDLLSLISTWDEWTR